MRTRSLSTAVITFVVLLAVALSASCSKSDSTSPPVVTGPSFNFTFPATGTSHARTFTEVGTWNYGCSPHSSVGMTGTVTVSATSGADSVVVNVGSAGAFAYAPQAVTIMTGGYVRWVNVSTRADHTVTR